MQSIKFFGIIATISLLSLSYYFPASNAVTSYIIEGRVFRVDINGTAVIENATVHCARGSNEITDTTNSDGEFYLDLADFGYQWEYSFTYTIWAIYDDDSYYFVETQPHESHNLLNYDLRIYTIEYMTASDVEKHYESIQLTSSHHLKAQTSLVSGPDNSGFMVIYGHYFQLGCYYEIHDDWLAPTGHGFHHLNVKYEFWGYMYLAKDQENTRDDHDWGNLEYELNDGEQIHYDPPLMFNGAWDTDEYEDTDAVVQLNVRCTYRCHTALDAPCGSQTVWITWFNEGSGNEPARFEIHDYYHE